MEKALFLDRDGVINKDGKYLYKKEDITFVDGIFELTKKAIELGYIIIIVTNQSGIARGLFTELDVQNLHIWITEQFLKKGVKIRDFYHCPFHIDGTVEIYKKESYLRKPDRGMFDVAVRGHGIDLSRSIMIGDKNSDRINIEELNSYIIKSSYCKNNYDFETLYDAIKIL